MIWIGGSSCSNATARRTPSSRAEAGASEIRLQIMPNGNFNEVATILKTSTKAAKARAYRALERLRLSPEVLADE